MSQVKITIVGLAAISAALSAALVKQGLIVDGRAVAAVTPFGAERFIVTGVDSVWEAEANGRIIRSLTDPSKNCDGLVVLQSGKCEVLGEAFNLATYNPEIHDVFTRSGDRATDVQSAGGSKAPEFGQVVFFQQHRDGYKIPARCRAADGRVNGKNEHSQDLVIVPKGAVKADAPAEAPVEQEAPVTGSTDENPLG